MPRKRQPLEIWEATRKRIWERDKGVCQSPHNNKTLWPGQSKFICRGIVSLEECHIDHIRSGKLGTNGDDNLRVLCPNCHALRLDKRHRGMIASALKKGLIPSNWREFVW